MVPMRKHLVPEGVTGHAIEFRPVFSKQLHLKEPALVSKRLYFPGIIAVFQYE